MLVYINGLALGFSLIMALGPQNVFLIRQGALRRHAVLSVLICFLCDTILICASIMGLKEVLELHPNFQVWMVWFGVAFLFYYGTKALKQAFSNQTNSTIAEKESTSRLQIILMALGFSLLNPHAIIDSLVIIGSNSSQFPNHSQAFLCGVLSASFLWFTSLTFMSHRFSSVLARVTVWKRVELISGMLMLCLSFKLAYSQF